MGAKKAARDGLVTGVVLMTPLVITYLVLTFVLDRITGLVQPFVQATALTRYTGGIEPLATAIAAVLLVAALTLFGAAALRGIGDQAFALFERLMSRVPVVKAVYVSVRQVTDTMMRGGDHYDEVVLVTWPTEPSKVIGFVTGRAPEEIQEKFPETAYFVFVPLSPNPTGGHLSIQPESNLEPVDMSVEKGIKTVLTSGMITDEERDILEIMRER